MDIEAKIKLEKSDVLAGATIKKGARFTMLKNAKATICEVKDTEDAINIGEERTVVLDVYIDSDDDFSLEKGDAFTLKVGHSDVGGGTVLSII